MTNVMDGFRIVVLDNGFIYVGNLSIHDGIVTIADAKNIRQWGTSHGLGELALKGPTKNTVLDNVGVVMAPYASLQHVLVVQKLDKW